MRKLLAGKTPKVILLVVSLLLVMVLSIGGTLAWLTAETVPVVNTFTAGEVTTTVVEKLEGDVKNNVQIKNDEKSVDAYIRAMVVVTWQKGDGDVYGTAPVENKDYTITWSGTAENGGWFNGTDGYYYHKAAVEPGNSTSVLFTECKPVADKAPEGYHLCVEVISSAIQAEPSTAVTGAWTVVTVDESGNLTNASASE